MTTTDDDRAAALAAQRRSIRDVVRTASDVAFVATDAAAVEDLSLALAGDGIALRSLVPMTATLEELFFALTEGEGLPAPTLETVAREPVMETI